MRRKGTLHHQHVGMERKASHELQRLLVRAKVLRVEKRVGIQHRHKRAPSRHLLSRLCSKDLRVLFRKFLLEELAHALLRRVGTNYAHLAVGFPYARQKFSRKVPHHTALAPFRIYIHHFHGAIRLASSVHEAIFSYLTVI